MSGTFEPELGQALFSNQRFGAHNVPAFIEADLLALGNRVAMARVGARAGEDQLRAHNPTANVGEDADYENGTFAMRAYCWCEGETAGHEQGCPPNFAYGDLEITWYKHARRGSSMNRQVSPAEWNEIFFACLQSLPALS